MRPTIVLLVSLVVLTGPSRCPAQTDYSLRVRSLDVTFAGLLDDFLTDVYLNPARVSELEGPMVYAAKIPGRRIESPFPTIRQTGSGMWVENDYSALTFGTNPIGVSIFGSAKGKLGLSLGSEIGLSASENWDEDYWLSQSTRSVGVEQRSYGQSSDLQHYVLDLAIAPLKDENAVGIRLRGAYDKNEENNLRFSQAFGWNLVDPGNPYERYEWDDRGGRYERLALSVSAGLFRREALLRDAVVGVSYAAETMTGRAGSIDLLDEDPDGNGVPHPDYSNETSYGASTIDLDRSYTGFGGFLRAHFGWADHVRSAHSMSWSRSTGDGGYGLDAQAQQPGTSRGEGLVYEYDGTVDRMQIESSVGYHQMLFDDVLVAFAAHGAFARVLFDEDAEGEFSLSLSTVDTLYTSPYRQRHEDVDDSYRLTLPVGVEWSFHKYLKLRLGAAFFAGRTKTKRLLTNNSHDVFGADVVPGGFGLDQLLEAHDSDVGASFNNGLEINLNDRLIVDLAGYLRNSSVELASYYYLSARFVF